MEPDLLRQRRNLMVVSCVLWFFAFAGVQRAPEKADLAAFGVTIEVERPEAIFIALWVLFVYFLLRFCIYALAQQDGVRNTFVGFVGNSTEPILLEQLANQLGTPQISFHGPLGIPSAWKLREGACKVKVSRNDGTQEYEGEVMLPRAQVSRLMTRATIRFILVDRSLTDYALPFVLALCVAYYAGTTDWGGSISRLIP